VAVVRPAKSLGALIFVLALARVAWRRITPPPPLPATMNARDRIAAHAGHMLLYAAMFALPMLMPLFWVGFSLAVYPGARLLTRHGAARLLALSAFAGALASLACLAQPGLAALIGLQLIAGAAWGFSFLSALDLAGDTGRQGREATFVGLVFAALAVAAAMRIGIAAMGLKLPETISLGFAAGLWTCGALCAGIMLTRRPRSIQ
jgi:hypothetical protein